MVINFFKKIKSFVIFKILFQNFDIIFNILTAFTLYLQQNVNIITIKIIKY